MKYHFDKKKININTIYSFFYSITKLMFKYFILLCLFLSIIITILQVSTTNVWGEISDKSVFKSCETVYPSSFLREPFAASSSFVFIFSGIYFVFTVSSDYYDLSNDNLGHYQYIFKMNGIFLIIEGIGSFLSHACGGQCDVSNFIEDVGFYLVSFSFIHTFGLLIYIYQYTPLSHRHTRNSIFSSMFFYTMISFLFVLYTDISTVYWLRNIPIVLMIVNLLLFFSSIYVSRKYNAVPNYACFFSPIIILSLSLSLFSFYSNDCKYEYLSACWHLFVGLFFTSCLLWMRTLGREHTKDVLLLR